MIQILYVDDEPALCSLVKIYLEQYGEIRVDTEVSAGKALENLFEGKYDLIVSDYDMPEINGLEFFNGVRSTLGMIPFILFTGSGNEDLENLARESGIDLYLRKGEVDSKHPFATLESNIRWITEQIRSDFFMNGLRSA